MSALHLLLSIVRYPRKACRNGPYFARGMTAKPLDIVKAMNLLDDPFVEEFDGRDAKDIAEVELKKTDEIEASEDLAETKCEQLLSLIGQGIPGSTVGSSEEPPVEPTTEESKLP